MKKRFLKIFIILLLICSFMINFYQIYAVSNFNNNMPTQEEISRYGESEAEFVNSFGKSGYFIRNYRIDMNVNEDNSYDITEYITAYFTENNKHGIIRDIPIENDTVRNNGKKIRTQARITNIKVNEDYTESKGSKNLKLKIGSSEKTVYGKHDYIISYKYSLGNDKLKGEDELYFNLIGTEWDTCINNVNFKITMPKNFDGNKLGFTLGNMGSTSSKNVRWNTNGNVITGETLVGIRPYQGLTVRLTLPEGYYKKTFRLDSTGIFLIICIISIIISFALWYKYGRDENNNIVETVEFYPPEGLNSLEVRICV